MADKPDNTGTQEPNKGPEQPNGFPVDTPLSEMSVEQREAYWKHQSRKHEDAAKALKAENDQLKPAAAEAEALRQASLSEQEKALEAAREEARREGENLGATSWQRVAVEEAIIGAAKAAGRYSTDDDREAVEALLSMIDPSALITAEGKLDRAKVEKALSGLAPVKEDKADKADNSHILGLRHGTSGAGSVQAARQAFRDAHTTKTT